MAKKARKLIFMDFEEVVKNRHSIKVYQKKDVSDEIINKIIKLSNLSPSAGNLQARSVIVVKNEKVKRKIAIDAADQDWMLSAPVFLVILANLEESAIRYGNRGRELYALQDATIFTSYLQLIATSLGLATRWVGAFDEKKVTEILNITNDKRPIAIIPLGYPSEEPKIKPRKNLGKLILKEI